MIERHWKGIAYREKANQYIDHLWNETFPELKAIPGFKGVSILRRETQEGTAFLIITRWETLSAIKNFAGTDLELAVVPAVVQSLMVKYDLHAEHYTVVQHTNEFN